MIEFKGRYYQLTCKAAVDALIQFDGVLLHVWHLSDPFHRLFSSDEFYLDRPIFKNGLVLKLPNGGRIETDDREALEQLSHKQPNCGYSLPCPLTQNWVLILLGAITLVLGTLWLAKNGLLF
ncbi:MAG: hypothetical protein M0036_14280 [Desulfobacteraceae bacterium]|nr:hypothetical protein [Desulfobacteraceae bacterium]